MKEKFKLIVNKFKEFNRDTYGMLITVSWILLVICLVIKLFGGNWFELWWDNEKFIAACNYIENNTILKMVVVCVVYLMTTYPVLCIVMLKNKLNLKVNLIFIPIMILKSIIGWYIIPLAYILDFIIIILLPLIFNKFKNWKIVIFANVMVILFQGITIVVRNLSFNFNFNNTTMENALYQIDYCLMILLFYLYNFKRQKRKEIK